MPATTPLQICSRGFLLVGGDPITSFSDGTAESDLADAIYEDVARSALTNTRWRFATKQEQIITSGASPLGRWEYEYNIPSDCLLLHAVTVGDNPIVYDVYGDTIYANHGPKDTVIADYTYRASEVDWPPYFIIAVEYAMAAVFATSIARDVQLSSLFEQKANFHMASARRLDSQQQTTRKLNTSRFITQRYT